MSNLVDLVRQLRSLGHQLKAELNPIGVPSLWVPGMTMAMRHTVERGYEDLITGGGGFIGSAGQHIELGDCTLEAIEEALKA
jgi:hypothetical protein